MKGLLFLLFSLMIWTARGGDKYRPISSPGINFTTETDWNTIKAKAQEGKKLIFVDCYASWCGPCKLMDKEVYTSDSLGRYMNDRFVSVKIQMDSTSQDSKQVRKLYKIGKRLASEFRISGYPTFLILSDRGELIFKDEGYKDIAHFFSDINSALDPTRQYYRMVDEYKGGGLDYGRFSYLVNQTISLRDMEFAKSLVGDFIKNYLDELGLEQFCREDYLSLAVLFPDILTSSDHIFNIIYENPGRVDSVMGSGFSMRVIKNVVIREEIYSRIRNYQGQDQSGKGIRWEGFVSSIKLMYNDKIAIRAVADAELDWYKRYNDADGYCKAVIYKLKSVGPFDSRLEDRHISVDWGLNYCAWELFSYSSNVRELKEALRWSRESIRRKVLVQYIDTYANLLYKLGRVRKALRSERWALLVSREYSKKNGMPPSANFGSLIERTIEKMEKGTPTWR